MNKYKLVLMYNDDKTLNKLKDDDYFKVNESDFLNFNPHTTGFAKLVDKDDLEVEE